MVMAYAPAHYTDKQYVEHIQSAYCQAQDIRREIVKENRKKGRSADHQTAAGCC